MLKYPQVSTSVVDRIRREPGSVLARSTTRDMAMVGVGCRATSFLFVRPVRLMNMPSYCVAACPSRRRAFSSYVATNLGKAGSRVRPLRSGELRNGRVAGRNFQRAVVKAIHVSGPGSVDSPLMQSMQSKIQEDLSAESVSVKDVSGDGRHVIIDVIASAFEGKSAVSRQRLVYKAIWEELQGAVHAVDQLKTRTPAEVENSRYEL